MIFSFFKKRDQPAVSGEPFHLTTDLHSHFIPAIDDGSKSMQDSVQMLSEMAKMGYKKIITTPHIMADGYRNTPEIITEGLEQLKVAVTEANIPIELVAAAEYYLDDGFYSHLKSGNLLTIADEYLLVETSYISKPMQFEEMIFEISVAGYKPMLAHPERYRYIKEFEKEYGEMKEKGIYFQVNINSFSGHYGRDAKKKAEFLREAGMIDFLGSDIHRQRQVDALKDTVSTSEYQKIFLNNTILNQTL